MALSEINREIPILKGESCHWKDIAINTGGSQPVLQDVNYPDSSGGYTYRQPTLSRGRNDSSQSFRTIFWRTSQSTLELLEVSASQKLLGNALRLNFQDTPIVPRVCIQETYSEVVVMVTTTNGVYRLVFPHPSKIFRKDVGQPTIPVPSILANASVTQFRDPSNFHEFNHGGTAAFDLQCSSAWLTTEGKSWFALGTKGGSILLVCLTPIGLKGVSFQEEVREASIMQRLWSGIVPGAVRRGQEAPDTAHSVVVHPFSQGTVAFAICRDHKLRAWSCTNQECKISLDMRELLSNGPDLGEEPPLLQHAIRCAVGSPLASPILGIFLSLSSANVFLVIQPFVHSGQYQIRHLATVHGLKNATLIDFALDDTDIVASWSTPSGDSLTQQFAYQGSKRREWRTVIGPPPPPTEVIIPVTGEPREAYMDVIFEPGSFSTSCIAKALHTYGRMVGSTVTSTLYSDAFALRAEASATVESEIQQKIGGASVGQEEYTLLVEQSLARFYSCCLEYQRAADKPFGLVRDASTGTIYIVKKDAVSVLVPSDHVIHPPDEIRPNDLCRLGWIQEDDTRMAQDIWRLYKCVELLRDLMPDDHYDTLTSSGPNAVTAAKDMASVIISSPGVSVLTESLKNLHKPSTALRLLLEMLDLAEGKPEELLPTEDFIYNAIPDTRLFGPTSTCVLASSLSMMATNRFNFTTYLLLLECVMDTVGFRLTSDPQLQLELQKDIIRETAMLMQAYLTLYKISQWEATPVIQGSIESSTRQMAALEICDPQGGGSAAGSGAFIGSEGTRNPTLVELFIAGTGGVHMRAILGEGRFSDWNALTYNAVMILAKLVWPISASFVFPEFLMNKCQYTNVERYVNLLKGWCEWNAGSREFILGHSHLNLGAPEKAVACFTRAADLAAREDFLISKILPTDELEGKKMDTVYHLKVIRLLEQFSVPDLVIEYSYSALSFAMKDDKNIPTLWTKIFKHELELGHQEKAYAAITANPDPEFRRDCLRQFVVILCERGQAKDLVQFPCIELHDEMVSILEERARSVDLESNGYYDLLYAFHIQRGNYRKAASAMYEHACRLSVELPGVASLERQCTCYLATLNTLRIVDPKYQWIVKPVSVLVQPRSEDLAGASPKRDYDGDPKDIPVTKREVKVLELKDIEMEYLLVSARWKLVNFDPEYSFIAASSMDAQETVTNLVRAGLFDCAVEVCRTYKLSLKPVFESLASKCVRVSRSGPDSKTWQWLSANTAAKLHSSKESSPATMAWELLKVYLSRHYRPGDSSHYTAVTAKLLTLGFNLPQWLVKQLKLIDYPSLLRLYVSYDKLEEATSLAEELVSAMMGEVSEGYKDFGIQTPLRPTAPSVWLPYTSLDHILLALKNTKDVALLDLHSRLDNKLAQYLSRAKSVSEEMEATAIRREQTAA